MFSKYYQSELNYLREVGRAFALANPLVAGMLAERGSDPDVERLLEGFAFLTARIRERADDAVPEIVHGLTEALLPQYLRTIPACSLVEFTPQARSLRGRARVPAGSELATNPVDGTACLFRTTADFDLLPLTLRDTIQEQASATSPLLRLSFQTSEQGKEEIFQPAGLRLYIHAELAAGSLLLLWLLRYLRGIQVQGSSGKGVRLGPEAIFPLGFDPAFTLLPWPRTAPEGYRLVQELFTLPQKLLFFEVRGLQAAAGAVDGDRFDLVFEFERPPPLPARLGRDVFRLHCAPVINLFQTTADPIRHQALGAEHLLRAAGVDPLHMEIYSVDTVTGLMAGRGERRTYRPFLDFTHASGREEPAFFRLRRALSPINDGIDTYLGLGTPQEVSPTLTEETLSIEVTCTNRSLPTRLQLGDICAATPSSPTIARFKNILPVTRPVRPPLGAELHWRLLSHLAVNRCSLADPASLRTLLGLYNFQALADEPAARANQLRIDAIRAVEARPITRLLRGAPVRGTRTTVEFGEAGFTGAGDAFLFGAVLDELLATSVSLNSFNELCIRLQPSQAEYVWPARSGSQKIL